MTKLAYLVTHPIQYQAPLLKKISSDPEIDLTVFFQSGTTLSSYVDEGFGRSVEWDVDLLDGYECRFLPTIGQDRAPSLLFPVNYALLGILRREGFQAIWIHGYARPFHMLTAVAARLMGLAVLIRDEAWSGGMERSKLKQILKRPVFRALGRLPNAWLSIGTRNHDYWRSLGVEEHRIFGMPYAVDNDRFRSSGGSPALSSSLRSELGIDSDASIVLFASKLIRRKRCEDLIDAVAALNSADSVANPHLVVVGDGPERSALERRVRELDLVGQTSFVGFKNQSELARYYHTCDVFVLPSEAEQWGLVVNEVMNAGKAVVVSDAVGSAADLVRSGVNGEIFPVGEVSELSSCLERILRDEATTRRYGLSGLELIGTWGFEEDLAGLKAALRSPTVHRARRMRNGRS